MAKKVVSLGGSSKVVYDPAKLLNVEVARGAGVAFKKGVTIAFEKLIDELVDRLESTQAIDAIRTDKTTHALYGFENAEKEIAKFLNLVRGAKSTIRVKGVGGQFSVSIFGESFEKNLFKETPFPWAGSENVLSAQNKSWVLATENGFRQAGLTLLVGDGGTSRTSTGIMTPPLKRQKRTKRSKGNKFAVEGTIKNPSFRATKFISKTIKRVFAQRNVTRAIKAGLAEAGIAIR